MKKILSCTEISGLIVELLEADESATTQHAGSMDIHCGKHPRLGRITIVHELSKGEGFVDVIEPLARPTLSLAA